MKTGLVALIIIAGAQLADAQRFVDRSVTFNPLPGRISASTTGTSWMHSTGGWGEFGAYRGIRDRQHAWIQRLGGYVELARFGDDASLAFTSSIEFIADPHNDIRFNPRAILWDEGILFTSRAGEHFWQIGYFHRCKHDIDNLLIGSERSLIFGSILGKYLLPWTAGDVTEGLVAIRADLFTIRQDDQTPSPGVIHPLNLKRALGSVGLTSHMRRSFSNPSFGMYLTAWGSVSFYSSKTSFWNRFGSITSATLNGGLSGGIAIRGNAHFRIGLTLEYLSDTGIDPVPSHARLLSFGVVIHDPLVLW